MDSEVAHDFSPFFQVYKDGRVERFFGTEFVPPSLDPRTGVSSKDVIIAPETGVSARIYIPKIINNPIGKLPLLVYFHGGAFCLGSAFSPTYHSYLNSLVAEANVVAVSVEYRLAPEHLLPIAYHDSWASFEWVASHSKGEGSEAWLKDHADFSRVFFAGDSAGANIAHNMAMRAGAAELDGLKLLGVVLVHPYFLGEGEERVDKLWHFLCPSTTGCDDPRINPAAGPSLSGLGCTRVLVCVAEKDRLRERGVFYYETLGKSGWEGEMEIMETDGEDHVFHLFNPTCQKAVEMTKKMASFMNRDIIPSL
ncbi:hypothetical protein HHK36_009966 [Tetracentron sinense]|uniref:Alpha/beta hydrolase fold-3 domain-containing protein n=1 Tax=Tetracentron sinense TaxID=13715 RepID=A0A834ZBQ8_TETSI|nr:hypothetical protein HHK36_009966 [Tetracentron sinense]